MSTIDPAKLAAKLAQRAAVRQDAREDLVLDFMDLVENADPNDPRIRAALALAANDEAAFRKALEVAQNRGVSMLGASSGNGQMALGSGNVQIPLQRSGDDPTMPPAGAILDVVVTDAITGVPQPTNRQMTTQRGSEEGRVSYIGGKWVVELSQEDFNALFPSRSANNGNAGAIDFANPNRMVCVYKEKDLHTVENTVTWVNGNANKNLEYHLSSDGKKEWFTMKARVKFF